jgi:hypothetical protein
MTRLCEARLGELRVFRSHIPKKGEPFITRRTPAFIYRHRPAAAAI